MHEHHDGIAIIFDRIVQQLYETRGSNGKVIDPPNKKISISTILKYQYF
jgi:hypothetical protein